jgi:hypothetical protein
MSNGGADLYDRIRVLKKWEYLYSRLSDRQRENFLNRGELEALTPLSPGDLTALLTRYKKLADAAAHSPWSGRVRMRKGSSLARYRMPVKPEGSKWTTIRFSDDGSGSKNLKTTDKALKKVPARKGKSKSSSSARRPKKKSGSGKVPAAASRHVTGPTGLSGPSGAKSHYASGMVRNAGGKERDVREPCEHCGAKVAPGNSHECRS